jgi:hypothetical protein
MMQTKPSLSRRIKLAAALVLAIFVLAGCIRSVLGTSENFFLLAGKKIIASAPIPPSSDTGAAEGATNVSNVAPADQVFVALDDVLLTQTRLRELPAQEVTAAALLGAPVAPGFYHVSGSLNVPAGQSLNLTGDGLHVFNLDGILNLEPGASIQATSDVNPANVFWNTRKSASLGAATEFKGILISEGDITVGANALVGGKLFSRAGNVVLNTTQVSDTTQSGPTLPSLSIPANVYRVAPGKPLTFNIDAGLLGGFGQVGIFAKGLPAGAVVASNLGGVDTTGPNGSDLLNVGFVSPVITSSIQSTFSWTPTSTGTYKITFLARSAGFMPTVTTAADLTSGIDVRTVTIEVGAGGSAAGLVSGSGKFGSGVFEATFSVAVSSRGSNTGAPASGTFRLTTTSPRLTLQASSLTSVQVNNLDGGGKAATIQGFLLVPGIGQTPFTATAIQSAVSTQPDVFRVTLAADLRRNGSETTTFGGLAPRRNGVVVIR